MNERDIAAYVDAATKLQGIALRDDERARVIEQFARIVAIAAPVVTVQLPDDAELATVYQP